ncbi:hypothetical protein BLNAU_3542 [Blattamonas nauphoetae]|uniref:Uncharacterized protein n=1 Tax=Blattamonas nauphoetae TaxID=2049346 RepID=A0ABQ9YCD0_9EUKA|nr:hypothetical protein BLNAU_3542 [Blattamonas nauphoetae]
MLLDSSQTSHIQPARRIFSPLSLSTWSGSVNSITVLKRPTKHTASFFIPVSQFRIGTETDEDTMLLRNLTTKAAKIVNIMMEMTKPIPLLHSSFKWKGQIHTSSPPLFLSTALPFLRTFLHSQLMKEEEFIVLTQAEAVRTRLSTSVKPPPFFTFCSEDEEVSMEYCKLSLNVMLDGLNEKE